MLGNKAEPHKSLKAELVEHAENVHAYMEKLNAENAMPPIKGKLSLPIDNPQVRQKVRIALEAITREEGELIGKPFDQRLFFLTNAINAQEEVLGYNPYRDTSLAMLLVLSECDYLLQVHKEQFPDSKTLNKLLKPLHKAVPMGMMRVLEHELSDMMQSAFPYVMELVE